MQINCFTGCLIQGMLMLSHICNDAALFMCILLPGDLTINNSPIIFKEELFLKPHRILCALSRACTDLRHIDRAVRTKSFQSEVLFL